MFFSLHELNCSSLRYSSFAPSFWDSVPFVSFLNRASAGFVSSNDFSDAVVPILSDFYLSDIPAKTSKL